MIIFGDCLVDWCVKIDGVEFVLVIGDDLVV